MTDSGFIERWERAPCGLLTLLPNGMVIEANQTFLSWVGRDAGEVIGRARLSEFLSAGGRIYWETHLSPILQVEGRVNEVALELKVAAARLPVLLSAEVTEPGGSDGAVIRVAIARASERSRYEQELRAARASAERSAGRVRLLQATTAALSQALGVGAVGDALAAAAIGPLGAASATVWLVEGDEGLVVQASTGDEPQVMLPAGAFLHESLAVQRDDRVIVPLRGPSELQGVLTLTTSHEAGAEPLDLEVLTAVGQQAGIALERAQLYEQSASVARELQHSLLAVEPPADDRFSVATIYRPGVEMLAVGGDWYDVFLADDELLAVVVGDVVGRGLRAASAMGQLRSAVRAVAAPGVGPGKLQSRLDRFVDQVEAAAMATVVYAELELASGKVTYACAGHPPPLLLPAVGQPRLLWDGRSAPLGAFLQPHERMEGEVRLNPGDRLLLYTDGLVERRDRAIDEGLDLLAATSAGLEHLPLDKAVRLLTELMLHDERIRDDVCVLLLSWHGGGQRAPGTTGPDS